MSTHPGLARNVLVPYEITLLSNHIKITKELIRVLVPYEITLLSNTRIPVHPLVKVLVPYEITLLSNLSQKLNAANGF